MKGNVSVIDARDLVGCDRIISMPKGVNIEHLAELSKKFNLADIYVFGSRAKEVAASMGAGTMTVKIGQSDIDIAVRPSSDHPLSPREVAGISVILEDLLNSGRVDLTILPDVDPFLALDIVRGELLFTNNPVNQANYELSVLRRAGDLAPFKRTRIKLILEEHSL
jgi:uncharacterized protein